MKFEPSKIKYTYGTSAKRKAFRALKLSVLNYAIKNSVEFQHAQNISALEMQRLIAIVVVSFIRHLFQVLTRKYLTIDTIYDMFHYHISLSNYILYFTFSNSPTRPYSLSLQCKQGTINSYTVGSLFCELCLIME